MSDSNTKVAFWVVGAAAAAAIVGTLSIGARAKAVPAGAAAPTPSAQAAPDASAPSGAELPSGLSLLPLVKSAEAGASAAAMPGVAASAPDVPAASNEPLIDAGAPLAQVAFESGQASLSPKAKALLLDIAVGVKKMDGATLVLSGFHDATGSPELNARLAKERAQAVRNELVAKGMPADRIKLQRPQVVIGAADPALARRVDIGLVR